MGYERKLSARQKALELGKKKDAIEAEMDVIYNSLTKEGGPGMSGNLLDAGGFPRSDIDVHGVRIQRNRFATLRTDHRMVVQEMEKLMHIALAPPENREASTSAGSSMDAAAFSAQPSTASAAVLPTSPQQAQSSQAAPSESVVSTVAANGTPPPRRRVPFALVDIVIPGSPAATADLKVQDEIVAFGGVSLTTFATPILALGALPGLLRAHENRSLEIVVERKDDSPLQNLVTLSLTPQRWSGQGLLGCHVVPLQVSQQDEIYRPDVATATERHSAGSLRPP